MRFQTMLANVLALAGVAEIHNLSPKISKISIQVVFLRKEKRAIAANACLCL